MRRGIKCVSITTLMNISCFFDSLKHAATPYTFAVF